MLRVLAALVATASLAACSTIQMQEVTIRESPGDRTARFDAPRMAWYGRPDPLFAIRFLVLLRPGETIPKQSVWVRKFNGQLYLCYTVAAHTAVPEIAEPRTMLLYVRGTGIPRSLSTPIIASRTCGKA